MIKSIIKAKATLKITQGDTALFQHALNAGTSIAQSASYSVVQGLNEMSIEDLEAFKNKLGEKSGKTTNKNKMYSVYNYLTAYKTLTSLQEKLTTAIDDFKTLICNDFDEHWHTEQGELEYERFKETISNIIAVKKSQTMRD